MGRLLRADRLSGGESRRWSTNTRARPYDQAMRLFRRRSGRTDLGTDVGTSKEAALAEARSATARLRREQAKVERYRAGKQANPQREMTTDQWLAGGS